MVEPDPVPEPEKLGWKEAWRHRGQVRGFGWRTVRKRYAGKTEDAVKAIFVALVGAVATWGASSSTLATELRVAVAILAAGAFVLAGWEVAKAHYCAPVRIYALQKRATDAAEKELAKARAELEKLRAPPVSAAKARVALAAFHVERCEFDGRSMFLRAYLMSQPWSLADLSTHVFNDAERFDVLRAKSIARQLETLELAKLTSGEASSSRLMPDERSLREFVEPAAGELRTLLFEEIATDLRTKHSAWSSRQMTMLDVLRVYWAHRPMPQTLQEFGSVLVSAGLATDHARGRNIAQEFFTEVSPLGFLNRRTGHVVMDLQIVQGSKEDYWSRGELGDAFYRALVSREPAISRPSAP